MIFSVFTILQGVEFPIFLLIFFMGLTTVQRYCAACDQSMKGIRDFNVKMAVTRSELSQFSDCQSSVT